MSVVFCGGSYGFHERLGLSCVTADSNSTLFIQTNPKSSCCIAPPPATTAVSESHRWRRKKKKKKVTSCLCGRLESPLKDKKATDSSLRHSLVHSTSDLSCEPCRGMSVFSPPSTLAPRPPGICALDRSCRAPCRGISGALRCKTSRTCWNLFPQSV